MITIEGKDVFTELAELVDPAHTALVLIDMQRDFIEPDGVFGKLGIDLSMYAESRPRLAALLAAARQSGIVVVHVQNTALPGRMGDSPSYIRFNLRMHQAARRDGPPLRYTIPGTPGHDEWWQTREGRIVSGLYNNLKVGMPRDERAREECDDDLDELTLEFYGGGEG